MAGIERFWREGHAAYPPQAPTSQPESRPYLKLPDDTCCEGVDVPAVGLVHTFDCKQSARPVLRASQVYVPGEVPQPLREFVEATEEAVIQRVAGLLGELLFAARDLAETRIGGNLVLRGFARCLECGATEAPSIVFKHAATCHTGRVLRVIADILKTNGKEAAADGEEGRAGQGVGLGASVVRGLDQNIARILREDHQNQAPHHANLCSICLILAAFLGEARPTGPWPDPAERAIVYARALNSLSVFPDEQLTEVIEAARAARAIPQSSEGWADAQWNVTKLLPLRAPVVREEPFESWDDVAYEAIQNAVRAVGGEGASRKVRPLPNFMGIAGNQGGAR